VPSIGSDAGSLLDALYCLKSVKPFVELTEKLAQKSSWTARLRSVDAAGGNAKFLAYEQGKLVPACEGHAVWLCSIHQSHLVVTHTVTLLGMPLISALYSSCLLLRTGGYFLRLVLAVRLIVREQALLVDTPASDDDIALCAQFLEYTRVDDDRVNSKILAKQSEAKVVALFNCGMGSWLSTRRLCHYCTGENCCPGGLETTLERMTDAIITVILRICRISCNG